MTNPHTAATPIRRARPDTTQPDQPRELLRVEDAAARLAIGRTTMFALLKSGAVASLKLGSLRCVPADAIAAYIDGLPAAHQPAA
jgi:excisionase family DNA binding protein